ncbi:hypothetical protein TNCV_932921 [Trichonephila clavipes]|nr:hypothetical protein TNCV_932921 [Trichonephila clavipes]
MIWRSVICDNAHNRLAGVSKEGQILKYRKSEVSKLDEIFFIFPIKEVIYVITSQDITKRCRSRHLKQKVRSI